MKQLFLILSFVMLPLTGNATVSIYLRYEDSLQKIMESQYPNVLKQDHSLKIEGHMNFDDLKYLRSKMVGDGDEWIEELDLDSIGIEMPIGDNGNDIANLDYLKDINIHVYKYKDVLHDLGLDYLFADEGKYYSDDEIMRSYMFYGCNRLRHLILPYSIRCIGSFCVAYCENLERLEFTNNHPTSSRGGFPLGVQDIRPLAVYHCPKLREVTLSYYLKTISTKAFAECDALERVYITNDYCPPAYGYNCFPHPEKIQLVVVENYPHDMASKYANAPGWNRFGSITTMTQEEYIATTVSSVRSQAQPQQDIYNLNGHRLTGKPSKGVYIEDGRKIVGK